MKMIPVSKQIEIKEGFFPSYIYLGVGEEVRN